MSIKAIECPDGVCHSHHGGHAVPRQAMQKNLEKHGKDWCEKLAERIYEMSVDTYSQTVMPSLHSAGWQSCLLYTSPSPRDGLLSRMPSSA